MTPYIAMGRDRHHPPVEQRWTEPSPLPPDRGPVDAMAHRLSTIEGRAIYGKRKSTVEPVFGIIKSVMGFRQFHLRGLDDVSGEWTLVTMAWNLKRLFNLSQQSSPTTDPRPRSLSQSRKRRSGSPQWSGNVPRQSISAFIRRIVFEVSDHTLFVCSAAIAKSDGLLGACAAEEIYCESGIIGPYFPDFSSNKPLFASKSIKSVLDSPLSRYDPFCRAGS